MSLCLWHQVVEDAVSSFKELEKKLSGEEASSSAELRALTLSLQKEVIALKAKQQLQQKELLHCNRESTE